jgi:hypothetical protein
MSRTIAAAATCEEAFPNLKNLSKHGSSPFQNGNGLNHVFPEYDGLPFPAERGSGAPATLGAAFRDDTCF